MSRRTFRPASADVHKKPEDIREDRLVAAMEEFRAAPGAGQPVDRQELLHRYSDVAEELADCLAGMEMVQDVARQVTTDSGESTVAASSPHTLGDFKIAHEIGRGGMGVVYEAEQLSLGRAVALKVLPFAAMLDDKQLQRFKNEARAAATLNHPNIVPVHFVGTERGVHFYAMQLIEGHSLAEIITDTRRNNSQPDTETAEPHPSAETRPIAALSTEHSSDPKRYYHHVAEIGHQIALALSHAHQRGIIHRDVKPANILVDTEGKPWITDFGLARTDSDASMTISGDVLGTLRYMSPEQASGERELVDDRADVYSLGATLYELATLRPVFEGANRAELLGKISSDQVKSLRHLNPSVPLEFETIVLKAIAKEPDERYASAQAFADDLHRFLHHEPIRARRPSILVRGSKWARRHTGSLIGLTLVLTAILIATSFAYYATVRERAKTVAALAHSEENFAFALATVDDMYLQLARRWIANDSATTVLQQDYLRQARVFYERVASQPIADASDRGQAARVFERIGQIEHYLENYRQADEAYRQSIEFGEKLIAQQPTNLDLRRELPRRYRLHAETLVQMADLAAAAESYESGHAHLEALKQQDRLTPEDELELVQLHHGRATLLLRTAQLAAAESLIRDARLLIDSAPKDSPISDRFRVVDIQNRRLLATALLARGDILAARDEANSALNSFRIRRDWRFSEDRKSIRLETQLIDLIGLISEAGDQFSQAAGLYRESLEIQRQNLQAHKEPSLFFVTTRLMGEKGQYEAGAFCDYVETQLRLARVLIKLSRPYEGENRLGQCMLTMNVILADRPNVLRYYVAAADTWALAAEMVGSRRPNEAKRMIDYTDSICRRAMLRFPSASDYLQERHLPSGSQMASTLAVSEGQTEVPTSPREISRLPEIAFCYDATGCSWFEAGQYEMATRFFMKSMEAREADHAYAFVRLAMSHAALNEMDRASSWLEKANERIRENNDLPSELIDLEQAAARFLGGQVAK